jgi:cell division inhibitor SepF
MGAMYRLKAYFGMVPAEELGEYADEPVSGRYADPRRHDRAGPDDRFADDRYDDRFADDRWDDDAGDDRDDRADRSGHRYDDGWDSPAVQPRRSGPARTAGSDRSREQRGDREPLRGLAGAGMAPAPVRGALAVDPETVRREPARVPHPPAPVAERAAAGGVAALARITTLQPRSYNEARTIGERYRDGVPVIMNLTELDDAAAKRLVDFAAGLAFALRGSIDKVTSRVFLLTPADVEVSADDARRLAERGLFRQD